jgi:uncharacterized protein
MDENLTNFVNLLNRQRQRVPVPEELSGLPNWAQRELVKRPETAPVKQAAPLNGTKHDAEAKSDIVVEAKRADAAPSAQPPIAEKPKSTVVGSPLEAKPVVEILPPEPKAKAEIPLRAKAPAAADVDPKRDPEAWLARFLAEEAAPHSVPSKQAAADKSAPAEKKIAAEKKVEAPPAAEKKTEPAAAPEKKIEPPPPVEKIEPAPVITDSAEIMPLQPVMAEALASPRDRRRPAAYALAAAAVIAVVALVVGAYWYTHSEPEMTAGTKPAGPTIAAVKPSPTLAKDNPNPATARKTVAAKPAAPAPKLAAAKPATPTPAQAAKPAVKVAAVPATPPTAKPALAPANVKPAAPVVAQAQKAPVKPQPQAAAQPTPAMPAVAAPKSAPQASTQIAMLPNAIPPAAKPVPTQTAMLPTASLANSAPPLAKTQPLAKTPPAATQTPPATAATGTGAPTWQRNAIPAPPFSGQPQIAIVIDDLGLDRDRTARAIALDGPVTLSFLAYASDLPSQTAAARKAGHELIVHVPMDPIIRPKYVSQTGGATPAHAELLRRLRWDLSRFTGYVGVNNHLGNGLSSDSDSTQTVIAELKTRGLLFLDSHVAGAGILKAAAREGVPAVTRDVLLDDDVTASSVTERLADLEKIARQQGTAIAIGHPHDFTLDALKVWIASLPAKGLQLVPLTAVVRDREQRVTAGGAG